MRTFCEFICHISYFTFLLADKIWAKIQFFFYSVVHFPKKPSTMPARQQERDARAVALMAAQGIPLLRMPVAYLAIVRQECRTSYFSRMVLIDRIFGMNQPIL